MRYLVDTNVLLRLLQRNDLNYSTIRQAVRTLMARDDEYMLRAAEHSRTLERLH